MWCISKQSIPLTGTVNTNKCWHGAPHKTYRNLQPDMEFGQHFTLSCFLCKDFTQKPSEWQVGWYSLNVQLDGWTAQLIIPQLEALFHRTRNLLILLLLLLLLQLLSEDGINHPHNCCSFSKAQSHKTVLLELGLARFFFFSAVFSYQESITSSSSCGQFGAIAWLTSNPHPELPKHYKLNPWQWTCKNSISTALYKGLARYGPNMVATLLNKL